MNNSTEFGHLRSNKNVFYNSPQKDFFNNLNPSKRDNFLEILLRLNVMLCTARGAFLLLMLLVISSKLNDFFENCMSKSPVTFQKRVDKLAFFHLLHLAP